MNNEEKFWNACVDGDLRAVKFLCQFLEINPHASPYDVIISRVCLNGHLEVLKYLVDILHIEAVAHYMGGALDQACVGGHIDIVKYLLSIRGSYDVNDLNRAIRAACSVGNLDIVKHIIETNPTVAVDPSLQDNIAIKWAVGCGNLELVKLLLTFQGVSEAILNSDILSIASMKGYSEIVKLLVGIYSDVNKNIEAFITSGNLEITKFLMGQPDVNSKGTIHMALKEACFYGRLEIVKYFVELPDIGVKDIVEVIDYANARSDAANTETLKFILGITGVPVLSSKDLSDRMTVKEVEKLQRTYLAPRLTEICSGLLLSNLSTLELVEIVTQSIKYAENMPFHIIWNMICFIRHGKH